MHQILQLTEWGSHLKWGFQEPTFSGWAPCQKQHCRCPGCLDRHPEDAARELKDCVGNGFVRCNTLDQLWQEVSGIGFWSQPQRKPPMGPSRGPFSYQSLWNTFELCHGRFQKESVININHGGWGWTVDCIPRGMLFKLMTARQCLFVSLWESVCDRPKGSQNSFSHQW